MICAFGLFWWTTIAGRLWCGYSCPQTVYTEIMLWIDNLVEGDRNKRLKLEKSPWNFTKIRIKATKYLLISLSVRGQVSLLQAGLSLSASLFPIYSPEQQAAAQCLPQHFTDS